MAVNAHLLVVDDDDRIRDLLKRYLSGLGHRVTTASDAEAAKRMLSTLTFDLLILDIMMPGEDGLSLMEWAGLRSKTPVLLLTAKSEIGDRIDGLKRGADDYVVKPFEPEELALRITNILKRSKVEEPVEEIEMSGLVFQIQRGELRQGEKRIKLTDAERQLLSILAARLGEPVSRQDLATLTSAGVERTVDVQVTRLRKKIEADPKDPVHLQTVRGVGYRLMPD